MSKFKIKIYTHGLKCTKKIEENGKHAVLLLKVNMMPLVLNSNIFFMERNRTKVCRDPYG